MKFFFYRKKLYRVTSLNNNVFISLSTFMLHHKVNVKSQDQFYLLVIWSIFNNLILLIYRICTYFFFLLGRFSFPFFCF